jgi:hypothetical protein
LRPGGFVVALTASEDDIRRRFVNRYFPRLVEIDSARYGNVEQVLCELRAAGFEAAVCEPILLRRECADARFYDVILTRSWTSLVLLPEHEYVAGVRRLLADRETWARGQDLPSWQNWRTVLRARKPI